MVVLTRSTILSDKHYSRRRWESVGSSPRPERDSMESPPQWPARLSVWRPRSTWVTNVEDTYYLLGSVVGPHPYPTMVRDFQTVIGREARRQILKQEGKLPKSVVACVGGGSNSIGIFY